MAGFKLTFPDSSKRAKQARTREEAIDEALVLADEHTVEVFDVTGGEDAEPVLLARYEKRDEPLYAPADDPE